MEENKAVARPEVIPAGLEKRKIFTILQAKDSEDMELQITKALLDGYVLHRAMFIDKGIFYQCMVNETLLNDAKAMGLR